MPRRLDLGDLAAPLTDLVRRQEGLVRRSQLREHGVDRFHVAARVASGRWQLVAPEVVSTDNGRLDRSQLLWRAVLHAPGPAWVGHLSSLEEQGLSGWTRDDVHLLVPRARIARLRGVAVHQSERVPARPRISLQVCPSSRLLGRRWTPPAACRIRGSLPRW